MEKKYIIIIVSSLLLVFGFQSKADSVAGSMGTGGMSTGMVGVVIGSPVANPVGGTYSSEQSVTLMAPGSSSIRYTEDGSAPDCSTGTIYSGAISVSSSEVISAISCYLNNYFSSVTVFGYAIKPIKISGDGGGGIAVTTTTNTTNVPAVQQTSESSGDTNNDGVVDATDFSVLMADWGETGSNIPADLNNDGVVDELDFAILMANWGS